MVRECFETQVLSATNFIAIAIAFATITITIAIAIAIAIATIAIITTVITNIIITTLLLERTNMLIKRHYHYSSEHIMSMLRS